VKRTLCRVVPLAALLLAASLLWAQFPRQNRIVDRSEYPSWEVEPDFKHDVFTFARIQFDSHAGRGIGEHWSNDYPDCDWNFSFRLNQLTSMKVDPNGRVLRLTDPDLFDYPFIFMSNAQQIALSDDEVLALRRYLSNGGFLMVDDFWAPAAWNHVREVMHRVLPDQLPHELSLDHEIFHCVYDLKKLPQVPSILAWRRGDKFEYWHGDPQGDEGPHFYGITGEDGRLVALLCHNNDIGDGWEREGEDIEYFKEYSEKCSYPLGINIIVYVMTR
jgi:hypothetical protein